MIKDAGPHFDPRAGVGRVRGFGPSFGECLPLQRHEQLSIAPSNRSSILKLFLTATCWSWFVI
jgi:hypothetical protein